MTDNMSAVVRVPVAPTYEQLSRMAVHFCCTVDEMAETWVLLLSELKT